MGIAGSMASGIIEYLAEGTWTKRLHPGWAAQCGLRAALLGKHGFSGPRTVLEGEHGFFFAFGVPEIKPDYSRVTEGLGELWQTEKIAFKPYACGTMLQPFIDCGVHLSGEGLDCRDIMHISCNVGEGTVHRLWEPSSEKMHPTTPYSAKFSGPFCIAVGLVEQAAGLSQFTEEKIADADILSIAGKVEYRIDPEDEYPKNYSGHIRATLKDGSIREVRQPYLRGGVRDPLARRELVDKFHANLDFGGISLSHAGEIEDALSGLFDAPDMSPLAVCRVKP
jgi:2-methylcitrate dehydratase PrpD